MEVISPEAPVRLSKVNNPIVSFLSKLLTEFGLVRSVSLGHPAEGRGSDPSLRRRRRERARILGAHARFPLYPFPGDGPRHAEHDRSRKSSQSVPDTLLFSVLTFYEALGAATAGGRAQWKSRAQDYQLLRAVACVWL